MADERPRIARPPAAPITPADGGELLSADANRRPAGRAGRRWLIAGAGVILAAASLPYAWAVFAAKPGSHFWGAIWYAPDDSLLLSVIREGLSGRWLHFPPYAMAPAEGAFFYAPYLLLGHLCRWTGLAPVHALHLGRLACGALLLGTLHHLAGRFFPEPGERRFAFFAAATGGGLGWLVLLAWGLRSPELSAPEAYPFFAMLTSLHLTLGIAALLWVLDALVPRETGSDPSEESAARRRAHWIRFGASALVLALVQPFGSVLAGCTGLTWVVTRWWRERRWPRAETGALLALMLLSLPVVLHQLTTIAANPAYVGWRTQVRTPTPPFWQVLAGIGLSLPFALAGIVQAARRRRPSDLLLLFWTGATALLMMLPYYQARRFDLAGYVPLVFLAVRGVGALRLDWSGSPRFLAASLNALGSLMVLGATVSRITTTDPELFLPRESWEAIRFLREHAPERAVVLAEPEVSLAVLASSPLRVVYGHPAETPDAARTLRAVAAYFTEGRALDDRLMRRVDYVLLEGRGPGAPRPPIPPEFRRVFARGAVSVFERAR